MATILHIETATTNCSVSIATNGKLIVLKEENSIGYSHSEQLHLFIKEALSSASLSFKDIDAIAVSKGPGSYTGLRIGVSAVKGLCFALDLPMIAVPTLQVIAASVDEQDATIIAMIDARRMEAFTAVYNSKLEAIRTTQAEILDENSFQNYVSNGKTILVGNSVKKCRPFLTHPNFIFKEEVLPSAKYMVALAYQKFLNNDFVDVAYFEPYYLKDFVALKPKKKF